MSVKTDLDLVQKNIDQPSPAKQQSDAAAASLPAAKQQAEQWINTSFNDRTAPGK